MRWFPFFIFTYLVIGVQLGLGGFGTVLQGRPNLLLLAAIFVAVNAQRDSALLGCLLLGLMQDLLTQQSPLGLTAFAYGLIGMFVISTQEVVYKDHALTHFTLGLFGGLLYALLVYGHGRLYYTVIHPTFKIAPPPGMPLAIGALYTAALAPFAFALLRRVKRRFGFRPLRTHGSGRM
jgi:rod shape-determining protein MreD